MIHARPLLGAVTWFATLAATIVLMTMASPSGIPATDAVSEGSSLSPPPESLACDYNALSRSTIRIAEALFYAGRLPAAIQLVEAAIGAAPKDLAGIDDGLLRLHIESGKLHAFSSFTANSGYDAGLAALEKGRRLADKIGNQGGLADGLLYRGFLLYSRTYNSEAGDYDEALQDLQSASSLFEEIGDTRGFVQSLIYIGIIHERQGDPEAARRYYSRSLDLAGRGGHKLELSYATRHLAFLHARDGQLEAALDLFRQSLALREEIGFRIYLPFSYLSVGETHAEMGNHGTALRYYEQACRLAEEIGADRALVLCLLATARAQGETGALAAASDSYREARARASDIQYDRGVREAETGLAALSSVDD